MANTAEDSARVDAIARYRIVGEPAEPNLESLARLAATLCGVSTAVVNIIDDAHQHQVAAYGVVADICSRQDSMCAVVLRDADDVDGRQGGRAVRPAEDQIIMEGWPHGRSFVPAVRRRVRRGTVPGVPAWPVGRRSAVRTTAGDGRR